MKFLNEFFKCRWPFETILSCQFVVCLLGLLLGRPVSRLKKASGRNPVCLIIFFSRSSSVCNFESKKQHLGGHVVTHPGF